MCGDGAVSEGLMAVLWLCGPPGVGKTSVGWEIYSRLTRTGMRIGYVDIDQLGICYPERSSDPGRHRMKARNLRAVIAGFQTAGIGCVVVSGVVDPGHGVPVDELPHVVLTVCRLRADRTELRRRFLGRQGQLERVDEVLREAEEMDVSTVAELCVDTTGLSVVGVARQVLARVHGWPVSTGPSRPAVAAPTGSTAGAADGPVLWLTGATGVGKSTAGFAVYQKALRTGQMIGYLDLDQINHRHPAAIDHRVRAESMAAIWRTYRGAGAQGLVVVGPVDDEATVTRYAEALPRATITLCRLHADRDQLIKRIMQRGQGGSWSAPGDSLVGQPPARLLRIADHAVLRAQALERAAIGLRIDTNTRTAEQTADRVLAQSGWLARRG